MSSDTVQAGWERVAMAIEDVADRLRRATQALEAGSMDDAVIGGNAVAVWKERLIPELAERLQQLLDDPDG